VRPLGCIACPLRSWPCILAAAPAAQDAGWQVQRVDGAREDRAKPACRFRVRRAPSTPRWTCHPASLERAARAARYARQERRGHAIQPGRTLLLPPPPPAVAFMSGGVVAGSPPSTDTASPFQRAGGGPAAGGRGGWAMTRARVCDSERTSGSLAV